MIDFIDLVEFCKRHTNKLSKVRVYGRITSKISEPKSLRSDVSLDAGSMCCNMDVIAVRLSEYSADLELLGISSKDNVYFVNGSISVIVDETLALDDWYAIDGTLRLSTLSRRAPIMGVFDFYKVDDKWAVHPTQTFDLPVEDFHDSERILSYIYQSDDAGHVIVPDEVLALDKFFSDVPDVIDMQIKQDVLNGFTESWKSSNSADEGTTVLSGDTNFAFNSHSDLRLGKRYSEIETILNTALERGNDFYNAVVRDFSADTHSENVDYMLHTIIRNLTRSNGTSLSGRQLIKRYLLSCGASLDKEYLGMPIWNFISNSLTEIVDSILSDKEFVATGLGAEYVKFYFADVEQLYAGIVAEIMGLPCRKFMIIAENLKKQGISFSKIVSSNPYILFFICDDLSVETIEYFATCFGVMCSNTVSVMDMTIQEFRCIAVTLSYLRKGIYTNSYISKSDFLTRLIGSYITSNNYDALQQSGTYVCDFTVNNACVYFKDGMTAQSFKYSSDTHWSSIPSGYLRALPRADLEKAVSDALNLGLLLEFMDSDDICIADMERIYDEFTLYQRISAISDDTCVLTDSDINSYIIEYESSRGIGLTPNQKSAVYLISKRVFALDGLVGTGKSIVIDCVTHTLSRVEPSSPVAMYSFAEGNLRGSSDSQVLILSEMELSSLDEIISVINTLPNLNRIIFVGDSAAVFSQTKGLVFRDILNIVPSQYLSDFESADIIETNSRALITGAQFKSANNFMLMPCEDNLIPLTTYMTCNAIKGTLGAEERSLLPSSCSSAILGISSIYKSRDIQVISPVDKASYSWGCYNMNNMLRSAFNTTNNKVFVWGSKNKRVNFKFGDRVMHTRSSASDICYKKTADGYYVPDTEITLKVGAIGTIVGVFDSRSCIFGTNTVGRDYTNYDDISFVGAGRFFVAVRYRDVQSNTLFFVLYHAFIDNDNSLDCLSLVGGDCDCIKLHYCSTPFRTTGHNSKVIVSLLGELASDGFVNRNMLYATWKQAKELLCVVGNVEGTTSMLAKARGISAYTSSRTLGGYLCIC